MKLVDPPVPVAGPAYRFAAGVAFGILRLQSWQFDVTGLQQVPMSGGAVIAANHTSFWDFFTVGRAPYQELGRPVRIMAKESLFHVPVFGPLMRRSQHIPVHRGGGMGALRSAVEALRAGELVLVLPEQTISTSFDLLPFKLGAARMAVEAGVPLIPSVSWGSQRFHTVGRLPRPQWRLPVSVAYGDPMRPTPADDLQAVTDELQGRVQGLLDRAQAQYPDRDKAQGAWWHPARLGGGAPTHTQAIAEAERLRRVWREQHSTGETA